MLSSVWIAVISLKTSGCIFFPFLCWQMSLSWFYYTRFPCICQYKIHRQVKFSTLAKENKHRRKYLKSICAYFLLQIRNCKCLTELTKPQLSGTELNSAKRSLKRSTCHFHFCHHPHRLSINILLVHTYCYMYYFYFCAFLLAVQNIHLKRMNKICSANRHISHLSEQLFAQPKHYSSE